MNVGMRICAPSTFWARLLGGKVDAVDDWHMILIDGNRG